MHFGNVHPVYQFGQNTTPLFGSSYTPSIYNLTPPETFIPEESYVNEPVGTMPSTDPAKLKNGSNAELEKKKRQERTTKLIMFIGGGIILLFIIMTLIKNK